MYLQLGLGEFKPTTITFQLADRLMKRPRGIIEDVLIKVDKFYFPVDFIVIDTELVHNVLNQIPVILGWPFLTMANALINCRMGVMKILFGNMTVELNIFNINNQPLDYDEIHPVCLIEEIIDEFSLEGPDDVNPVKNTRPNNKREPKIVLWTDSNGRPWPVVYDKQEPRYKEDATNGDGVSVW